MSKRGDRNTRHVVLKGEKGVCLHCGEEFNINAILPLNLLTAGNMLKAFAESHKHCTKKSEQAA